MPMRDHFNRNVGFTRNQIIIRIKNVRWIVTDKSQGYFQKVFFSMKKYWVLRLEGQMGRQSPPKVT